MRRRPVLTLILLSCLTFFLGLGRQALTDGDEAYYAEASREMVESGDWIEPHFNYEPRWEKPALYYWLTASLYEVAGPGEAAARFWSALSGVGLVLLTFAIARQYSDPVDAAWLAGAITATCFGYFAEARLALPDLPLTFFITLTIWSVLQQRWALAGVAAGLGFMTKGPVAVIVPAIVVLPIWLRERSLGQIRWKAVGIGVVLFLVIGTPWYVVMALQHGRAYLDSFFLGDNVQRFATRRFEGRTTSGWFYYGPILLGGLVPWTGYAATLLVARLAGREVSGRRWTFNTDEWRLLLWGLMPLLFYSLSLGKQPRYILPVLPPLAILIARAITRRANAGHRQVSLAIATLLTAAFFVVAGFLLLRARPLFINAYAAITSLGISALFGWAAAMVVMMLRAQWSRLPRLMALASATLLLTLQFGALAGVRPEAVEQLAHLVRAYRVGDQQVGQYRVFGRNAVFYLGFRQHKDLDTDAVAAFLGSPERVFLMVRESDLPELRNLGLPARELGRVSHIDTANIKLRTLLSPDPASDVETVLLVTNK